MAQIVITINSREYAVEAEDGQEANVLKLASMLDEKAKMISASVGQINENMLLAMVGLLIADELNETKKDDTSNSSSEDIKTILEEQDKVLATKIKTFSNQINSIVKNL